MEKSAENKTAPEGKFIKLLRESAEKARENYPTDKLAKLLLFGEKINP